MSKCRWIDDNGICSVHSIYGEYEEPCAGSPCEDFEEEQRNESELKPCPFCGGEAEQDDWRNNEHMFYGTGWIGCRKCRCFINYTGKDRGKEEAIVAWNRRAGEHEAEH